VIVSAEMNPNLEDWCKAKGVQWVYGARQNTWYPPGYDRDIARDVRDREEAVNE